MRHWALSAALRRAAVAPLRVCARDRRALLARDAIARFVVGPRVPRSSTRTWHLRALRRCGARSCSSLGHARILSSPCAPTARTLRSQHPGPVWVARRRSHVKMDGARCSSGGPGCWRRVAPRALAPTGRVATRRLLPPQANVRSSRTWRRARLARLNASSLVDRHANTRPSVPLALDRVRDGASSGNSCCLGVAAVPWGCPLRYDDLAMFPGAGLPTVA